MEIASIPYNINVNAPQKCLHAQAQIKCNAYLLGVTWSNSYQTKQSVTKFIWKKKAKNH